MPPPCSICRSEHRLAIEKALVAGTPVPALAVSYRLSPDQLFKHRHRHIPLRLIRAAEAREVAAADQLLAEVKGLRDKALTLLATAEAAGDLRTALAGVREARGCVELLARLLGELQEAPRVEVSILLSDEWVRIRTAMMRALEPFDEARLSVAEALRRLGGGGDRGN